MDNRSETGCGCIILMILITTLLLPFLTISGVAVLALAIILLLGALHTWLWRSLLPKRDQEEDAASAPDIPASEDVIDVEAHTVETRSADPQDPNTQQ